MNTNPRWDAIQSHPQDNVATLLRAVHAGEVINVLNGSETIVFTVTQTIPRCHKLALTAIETGVVIKKYGEIIGRAGQSIAAGDWVHVHNLQSQRGSKTTR